MVVTVVVLALAIRVGEHHRHGMNLQVTEEHAAQAAPHAGGAKEAGHSNGKRIVPNAATRVMTRTAPHVTSQKTMTPRRMRPASMSAYPWLT